MNIQDFILEENPAEVEEPKKKERKKSKINYEILASNEMDFVIEKQSPRINAVMAIIPSKEQYYITKTEKKGNTSETTNLPFSVDNIAWFLSGLEEDFEIDNIWISKLEKGKCFASDFERFISNKSNMIKTGLICFDKPKDCPDLPEIYNRSPKLALFLNKVKQQVTLRQAITSYRNRYSTFQPYACGAFTVRTDSILYLMLFEEVFGLDNTRFFIETFINADINFECRLRQVKETINAFYVAMTGAELIVGGNRYYCDDWRINTKLLDKNLPRIDFKTFTNYCIDYQKEGFLSLEDFLSTLRDDWNLQAMISDTIADKYPKNLNSHHQKLVFKANFLSQEFDKKQFSRYYEQNKKAEWHNDSFLVKVPKSADDMVDEAMQQSNCLRTYINDVIDGKTNIFFLRSKKDPETSLVTIQVTDNEIVQVKGRFNKEPSGRCWNAIEEWAKAKHLTIALPY